jgi:hypothetical protein
LVSLEDDKLAVARRILAQEAGVAVRAIETYNVKGALPMSEQERIDSARNRLVEAPQLLEMESTLCDLSKLCMRIAQKAAAGTKLVIIDQTSWITVPDVDSPFMEASIITRELKQLAKRTNVVIVAIVQVNRAGAAANASGQDLELYHLRDTGRFEQDADGVFIIQRIETETHPAKLVVDLKKHRHGRGNVRVGLVFTPSSTLVEDDAAASEPTLIDTASKPGAEKKERRKVMTTQEFVRKYVSTIPKTKAELRYAAESEIKAYKVDEFVQKAEAAHLIVRVEGGQNQPAKFKRLDAPSGTAPYAPPPLVDEKCDRCENGV